MAGSLAAVSARIRPYAAGDLDALYAISLATADAGEDASRLYREGRLVGAIFSAPYAVLAPESVLVAEDDDGVAGFVIGIADTAAFEARLEWEWWPALRARYPDPPGDGAGLSPDGRRIRQIHSPVRTPPEILTRHPAHMHLNLLPRARGRGLGRRMFEARRAALGPVGIHVGVNAGNAGGLAFWRAMGFVEIYRGERTVILGHPLDPAAAIR